jgi:hypothetical protein
VVGTRGRGPPVQATQPPEMRPRPADGVVCQQADCVFLRWSAMLSPDSCWRHIPLAEKPMIQKRRYLSYLLRLWQESGGDGLHWRASLERPQGGRASGVCELGRPVRLSGKRDHVGFAGRGALG